MEYGAAHMQKQNKNTGSEIHGDETTLKQFNNIDIFAYDNVNLIMTGGHVGIKAAGQDGLTILHYADDTLLGRLLCLCYPSLELITFDLGSFSKVLGISMLLRYWVQALVDANLMLWHNLLSAENSIYKCKIKIPLKTKIFIIVLGYLDNLCLLGVYPLLHGAASFRALACTSLCLGGHAKILQQQDVVFIGTPDLTA
ncbi:hypothetical protein ACJX0J_035188, partial [Zea mays]